MIALVTTPVLVHGLGTEAFGIWAIVVSLAVYRDVLQLGVATATPKFVAQYSALGDNKRVITAVATSFWMLIIPGAAALVLGLGLVAVFPHLFGLPSDLRDSAQILVLTVALMFALSIPTDVFGCVLMGLQRYDLLNMVLTVVSIAQGIGWVIVIAAGGGLVPLGIVTASLGVIGQVWSFVLARRLVPDLTLAPRRADRQMVQPIFGLSVWIAVEEVSTIILTRLDILVVGIVLGVEAAAVYGVAQKLTLAIGQIMQPVADLFFPHASELAVLDDDAGLRRSLISGTRIVAAVGAPLALAAALMAGPILNAWVGSGFDAGIPVVVFLSLTALILTVSSTGLVMLLGIGAGRGPAVIRGAESALNLGLSVVLAHLVGLEGVALGTLIAAFAANLLVLFPYMCRRFGVPLGQLVGTLLRAHAPPTTVTLLLGLALNSTDPSGIPAVAASVIAIIVTYVAIFSISGLSAAERRGLLAQLRRPSSQPDVSA